MLTIPKRPGKRKPTRGAARPPAKRSRRDAEGLTPEDLAFLQAYLANGGNGTQAYLSVYPNAKPATAATEAWKRLRKPQIAEKLLELRAQQWKRLEMQGDEAIALISLRARADIADAFDQDGKMLPVQEWPERLRLAVKGVKASGEIVLHDGLRASELMAQAAGRIKTVVDLHHFDHAAYLAGEEMDKP